MKYEDFLQKLSGPARRALENEGIRDFNNLSSRTEQELLSFHGLGPKSIPVVKDALNSVGLGLKVKSDK